MPLPAVVESLDAIPEPQRGAYVEQDGKYVLDVADLDAHPAAQGIKRKADELLGETKAERAKRKELEEKVKAFEKERETRDLESKGLVEHKKKWDEEILKPVLAEREALLAENKTLKLVGPVKGLFHKAEFLDADDAWTLFGPQFTLDEKGNPIVKDDPTKPVEKHIADLAAQKPWMVKGTAANGGGANGGGANGNRNIATPNGKQDPRQWTAQERADYAAEHGIGKLQDLVHEAIRAEKKAA